MKKMSIRFASLLLLAAIVLTGCTTSVRLTYMKPAEVNMGKYKNIAIASTVPFKGYLSYPMMIRTTDSLSASIKIFSSYSRNLPQNIADYATSKLVNTLSSTGFFTTVMPPKQTDVILGMDSLGYDPSKEFQKQGIDAVMIPRVENMGIDEYIWAEEKVTKVYDSTLKKEVEKKTTTYKIKRVADIVYTLTVIDCSTNKIVAKKTFTDNYVWTESFDPKSYSFKLEAEDMFKSMINDMQSSIRLKFVPVRASYYTSLMSNKPKLEAAKPAYEMANAGNVDGAFALFQDLWETYQHVPSGYNTALLLAGYGEYDEALDLLSQLRNLSSDRSIMSLYADLLDMKKKNEKGTAQLEGLDSGDMPSQNTSGSIYDFLLN